MIVTACILIILLSLLMAILLIPIRYSIFGSKYNGYKLQVRITWLYDFFSFNMFKKNEQSHLYFKVMNKKIYINKSPNAKKIKKKERKKQSRTFNKELIFEVIESVKSIILHIIPKEIRVYANIGFGEPYYNGLLFSAGSVFPQYLMNDHVNLNINFEDEVFEGECLFNGQIRLIVPVYLAVKVVIVYIKYKTIYNKNNKIKKEEIEYGR